MSEPAGKLKQLNHAAKTIEAAKKNEVVTFDKWVPAYKMANSKQTSKQTQQKAAEYFEKSQPTISRAIKRHKDVLLKRKQ